jgi:putative phosphonate catabolism associated alcohol dehydrogenase
MKSKIVIFEKAGAPLREEECEIPPLKEGEILVKNEYVTICRSDISTYTGRRIEKSPTILGHEIVGRIVDMKGKIDNVFDVPLAKGQRVTWAIYASNPESQMARRGIPQKADDLFKYGHEKLTTESTLHGGLAEYTILRRYTPVLPLSEDIPLPVASMINCAISTVAGSLRLAGDVSGKRVSIWGTGMLGVISCAMCKEAGAGEIIGVDISQERLMTAKRFGAASTFSGKEMKQHSDIAIDYSGSRTCMEEGVRLLDIGGTAVWIGGVFPQDAVRIDSEQVIRRILTIKGLHNYNAEDFQKAVDFITRRWNKYPFAELVYDHFTLDQAQEAFDYAVKKNPYRVGLKII